MKRLYAAAVAVALATTVLALPATAHALDLRQGRTVVVPASQTINDDVYAFGSTVQIDGTVNGDVVAAGGTVIVSGHVSGSVFAGGGTVRITGTVGGSVRAGGGDVEVDGTVANDMLLSGGQVRVGSAAKVGRDAALAGGTILLAAPVGRNADLSGGTAEVDGTVNGYARIAADTITLGPASRVGGDFEYWSDSKPTVSGTVVGKTIAHPAERTRSARAGFDPLGALFGWVRSLVGWVLFGILFVLVLPSALERSERRLTAAPWQSLGVGFAVMIVPIVLFLPVFLILLLFGGSWIPVAALNVLWLLMSGGFIVGSLWIGSWIGSRMSKPPAMMLAMLLGVLVVSIVGIVPFLGWLAAFAVTLFGTGSLALVTYDAIRAGRPLKVAGGGEVAAGAVPSGTAAGEAAPEPPAAS
jgi:cytoskeletal protein CcmA (bactofilin family)